MLQKVKIHLYNSLKCFEKHTQIVKLFYILQNLQHQIFEMIFETCNFMYYQ